MQSDQKPWLEILRQARLSFIFRALTVLSTYASVPLFIERLGQEKYGLWVLIISVSGWTSLADFGIGSALRNHVAPDGTFKNRRYLTVTFAALRFLVTPSLALLLTSVSIYVILSCLAEIEPDQALSAIFLSFVISIIGVPIGISSGLAAAVRLNHLVVAQQFIQSLSLLILVFTIGHGGWISFYAITGLYLLTLLTTRVALLLAFLHRIRALRRPWLLYYRLSGRVDFKNIVQSGRLFFILQLLVIFFASIDKVLLATFFDMEDLAVYDVSFKLFSVVTLVSGLLTSPLWTELRALQAGSKQRIAFSFFRSLFYCFMIFFVIVVFLAWLSEDVIAIWVGVELYSWSTILPVAALNCVLIWNSLWAACANALGVLKAQISLAFGSAVANIGFSLYFAVGISIGPPGIIWGSVAAGSVIGLVLPVLVIFSRGAER